MLKASPWKPDYLVWDIGLSGFSRLDRVRVGFEDFICLGKIWSYATQRSTPCYLYKYRSHPIVIYHQANQSNLHFSYFCRSYLFSRLDLLATATTSKVVVDLIPSLGQTPLDQEKDTLTRANGVPNYRWSWWNRTVRFAKPDHPVCLVLTKSFRHLFILCANNML
jgi:hypothetical protein